MSPSDTLVILNERAGTIVGSSLDEVTKRIERGFDAGGLAKPVIEHCVPDELESRLKAARDGGKGSIIVGGGDGTVATAAGLLRDSPVALGILPMGTFNLMARDLGVPLELEDAAAALATAIPTSIDTAEVNGRLYLCVCVLGFFPEVAMRRDAYRGLPWWSKALAMIHAMTRSYLDYPTLRLTWKSDGRDVSDLPERTRFAAVSNNLYRDEAGVIPEKESLTEGELAVYVSRHGSIPQVVRGSLAFVTGSTARDPKLTTHRCRGLCIESHRRKTLRVMIDGEIVKMESPLKFKLHPRSLTVLQPAKGNGGERR